jgi:phage N-6-adenine-methyltransferase
VDRLLLWWFGFEAIRSMSQRHPRSVSGVFEGGRSEARKKNLAVHFSSATDLWATPQAFFDVLHREFRFTLDVCALPENAKCAAFYTPEINGLAKRWRGVCWMNPPYGRQIGLWMRKAYVSAECGATVVCLVPARTDTAWWHDFVAKASEVRFVRGRLKFGASKNAAPFPSAVVVFRPPRAKYQKSPSFMNQPRGVAH